MTDADRFKLLHGPYSTPRVRLGWILHDDVRGLNVTVVDVTDARIPWPVGVPVDGRARSPVVYGALADAVALESNQAVAHWWGVTPQTVSKWRKALDVAPVNAGTRRLKRDYSGEPLFVAAREKAHAKNGDPDRRAKIAAAKRGKPRPWHVVRKMARSKTGSKHTPETRARMSKSQKERGSRPPKAARLWTAEEDELVRTLPPLKAAVAVKRTLRAVYSRRSDLKLGRA